jgi:hypothetical protein
VSAVAEQAFEPTPPPAPEKFEAWAYVEVMGHHQIAGRVSEQSIAGRVMLRVDIPDGDGFRTEFYGGSAIFKLTPTTEEVVRKIVTRMRPEPVFAYLLEARPRLTSIGQYDDSLGDEDER